MKKTYITSGEEETRKIAEELAKTLKRGQTVCLRGDLGVGKTVFAKGLCAALGIEEHVSSPTFTLVNEYESSLGMLYHFDLYRIEEEDELYEIGFLDFVNGNGIALIEWPERAETALPDERIEIYIMREGDNTRRITVEEQTA
ncbi:MAG: tRNA (adenosine(37)-N6)-threonylcarbamoyltransferase complex ATPase subunit type 1 TsaE [Ruminococcaceae bacterium]|nr:tRNA (adenosine(37)-N6)-threonylcarbamoyltransferase complex ATPase subunit type 1 TsaE [Oscillospiraceae bacterium]